LRRRIPEPDDPGIVDEEDAVGDRSDHARSLAAFLGFAVQPVAFLRPAAGLKRVADARSDRLEQRRLCLVEASIVEAGDADDTTERPPDERSAGERPCLQRAQSEVIINSR